MGSPLQQLAWDHCLLDPVRDREVEAWLKREAGSAPDWARHFLPAPWLAKTMIRWSATSGLLVHLDFHTADLLSLVVSQESSCRYCYAVTRMQLRALGMSEERVHQLEQRLVRPELDERSSAAVRFARKMARGNPLAGPDDLGPLRHAGFSDDEIREIVFVVADVAFYNRVSTIVALPPQPWENAPDLWYMRLLRPMFALIARRWYVRGKPTPLPGEPTGPFAAVIRRFDGSPIGPVLSATLEDLWTSRVLTRRCKALMFAVIGRGLGCDASCHEACDVLAVEGLDEAAVSHVLSHLGGPELDPLESLLVSFARDTIWYEPQAIQRRARQLQENLTVPQFVEAVGVAAMANSVCRLTAVLLESP
jgi:AhpD family alkylhydroperoxidase